MFSLFKRKKPFFSSEEQQLIVAAIQKAERRTSGEVKVFIESRCSYVDAIDRAIELFPQMGLHETAERNAVLVYIAIKDHQLAILGDEGIHKKVGSNYWKEEVMKMLRDFDRNDYAKGIAGVVEDIGEALQQFFPYTDTDRNELSDDIAFGR